jgi:AraC-like DNA-binding protein
VEDCQQGLLCKTITRQPDEKYRSGVESSVRITEVKPHSSALGKHVRFLYLLTRDQDEADDQYMVFPHTGATVSVNVSTHVFTDPSGCVVTEASATPTMSASLYGSFMTPRVFGYRGRVDELTIGFHPLGFNALFPMPLGSYLTNNAPAQFAPCDDFLPAMGAALACARMTPADSFAMVESYSLTKLNAFSHPWLGGVIDDLMDESNQDRSLLDVANKYRLSQKTMAKHFRLYVGKSPSDFRKVVRFRLAMKLRAMTSQNFASTAHAVNYFDRKSSPWPVLRAAPQAADTMRLA